MRARPLNILIIKLGALGDFVQATTAFAAIRKHYPNSQLNLLTTASYQDFANRLGSFNHIILDTRPKWHHLNRLRTLIRTLRTSKFDCVFDLQGVDRTKLYKRFLPKAVEWISHLSKPPLHPQERFQQLFSNLGIDFSPGLNLTAIAEPVKVSLQFPYILLIPGASPAHGGLKRWPEESYGKLAQYLITQKIQPIIIGGLDESFPLIHQYAPEAINLVGKTDFYQIIGLAQNAAFAIGNDTGPMLLAASGGCPTLTLYSKVNPPSIGGAKGIKNYSLQADHLKELEVDRVISTLSIAKCL